MWIFEKGGSNSMEKALGSERRHEAKGRVGERARVHGGVKNDTKGGDRNESQSNNTMKTH